MEMEAKDARSDDLRELLWKVRGGLAIVGEPAPQSSLSLHSLQTRGAMSNRVTLEIFSDYI